MKSSATFGPGGERSAYGYTLRRDWSDEIGFAPGTHKGTVLFLMLNPSTADASKDDPTVAKCQRLARRWGFGALEVRNIFALRSTDPKGLRHVTDPVGPENDAAIASCAREVDTTLIIAAWGNHGAYRLRSSRMRWLLADAQRAVYAFRLNDSGEPAHPLYQPSCELGELVRYL